MEKNDLEISGYMKHVLEKYKRIRGKIIKDRFSFWDVIVISAADTNQREAYEMQIALKEKYNELPLGVPIHIISDPPESKIGCGGSTMYALAMLTDVYGASLTGKRILFIPAGGYSQRLPSQSVLGKLFSPVPIGDPMYQMIDLIFAVYLPFLSKMAAGIFLTSSDAIISYFMENDGDWSFENTGFTALGHPSSIAVGENHGVYVLPKPELKAHTSFMSECIQVLQKPTKNLMREKGAIIEGGDKSEDIVYSDSVFFFDIHVATKLIQYFKKITPLKVEISSYGDFLQPLGKTSDKHYIGKLDNELSLIRMNLYELLNDTPLHVLVLNRSAFHHLGTMEEYIENYRSESLFYKHFSCSKVLSSTFLKPTIPPLQINGTVMHSILHPKSFISETAIVEYCNFLDVVSISDNCIVSNCQLVAPSDTSRSLPIEIPEGILIHTIAVVKGFVTIFFNVRDNLKASSKKEDVGNLSFLSKKLKDIQGFEHLVFESDVVSLWTAKLFPIYCSMDKSFRVAVDAVNNILNNFKPYNLIEMENCMSMADILKLKDVKKMLEFREELHKSILFKAEEKF